MKTTTPIQRARMRYTVAQIVDAVRQGYIGTTDEVLSPKERGVCQFTLANIANNLPMPALVFHREHTDKGFKYIVLSGMPRVLAIWAEAQRIGSGTPTFNIDQFWKYDVDIDFLDVDIETAKQTADRIREARW